MQSKRYMILSVTTNDDCWLFRLILFRVAIICYLQYLTPRFSTIIGDSTFDLSNPEELNEFKESRIYH